VRREIFLDLCLSILAFCNAQRFTTEKTSTLISILRTTHIVACERAGSPPALSSAYTLFEELLLKHSVERPPFSIGMFAHPDVAAITTYVVDSYFRRKQRGCSCDVLSCVALQAVRVLL
jgi:hypothetical protein